MKKYLLLFVFCACLAGCSSLGQWSTAVQNFVDSRQSEVTIEPSHTTVVPMAGCLRYRYIDTGFSVEFRSQICDGPMGHIQLYPVEDWYAIKTDTGISEPVIRFFHKDMANNIELDISNTLNGNLTGDAFLWCLVSLSPLQIKRQWDIWRYSVVPFGTYEETVKDIQKTDPTYRGCGMFDGSKEPYGYFEYHTWAAIYFFVQMATTGTLFDPNSFSMMH